SLLNFKLVFFSLGLDAATTFKSIFFTRLPQQVAKFGEHKVCALITPGIGRFGFTAVAHPTTGTYGVLQQVAEHRVDVVVNDKGDVADLRYVVYVLNEVRPYEEVANDVHRLENV
ncbi:hypothetical protein EDD16DRAFT_1497237, partial [Pisolithus croceorrhizus]